MWWLASAVEHSTQFDLNLGPGEYSCGEINGSSAFFTDLLQSDDQGRK